MTVCLCFTWHEESEDKGSFFAIKKICDICGKILDIRYVDK